MPDIPGDGGYSHYYTSVELENVFIDAPDTLSFVNILRPVCPDVKSGLGPLARRKIVPLPARARSFPPPAGSIGRVDKAHASSECSKRDGSGETATHADMDMRVDDLRAEEYDCACGSPVTPGLVNDRGEDEDEDDSDCDSVCFVYSDSDEDVSTFSSSSSLRRTRQANSRRPSGAIPNAGAHQEGTGAIHLFQSITATPGPGSWSFEELRNECYAQSRVATGTAPAAIASGAPSWMIIPPAFAPRPVAVRDASCTRDADADA